MHLVLVDRFYPSSQISSSCDHPQKTPLSVRVYHLLVVFLLDRDLKAAINLSKAAGLVVSACERGETPTVPEEAGSKPQCLNKSGIVFSFMEQAW
ncbi:zinc ribbon domain-containing protein [Cylindrospermum sp. FACHB-282]|uniref:zinc ribbon domain-containing protein n=1 Tax=Cylindrospermum sp. FACHB-282 TaxID=2692794 RepID=UPI00168627C2|nr:zinc ribbon domain-containing protein [Cylindrospermum sp. FACHB-282]MBD2387396.1 transposase [Cylindrospermum sp. FACHB-282]